MRRTTYTSRIARAVLLALTRRWETGVRRAGPLTAAVIGLTLFAAGCGGSAGLGAASAGAKDGQVSVPGSQGQTPGAGQGGQESVGSFTVAFAECMRTHGVPNFPNPNGQAGQLGPGSGVDPTSLDYQAALNGPCKSLAPPAWVSSGPLSNGGGGS